MYISEAEHSGRKQWNDYYYFWNVYILHLVLMKECKTYLLQPSSFLIVKYTDMFN